MKASTPCVPCAIRQAVEIAGRLSNSEEEKRRLLDTALETLKQGVNYNVSPAEFTHSVLRPILKAARGRDPYAEEKKHYNRLLMDRFENFRQKVESFHDPLEAAVRLSVAGNMIDFGVFNEVGSLDIFETVFEKDFAVNHYAQFKKDVQAAEKIVYLFDNAGEIVLDRLVVENLGPERVTGMVRNEPILNDVTLLDAEDVGLADIIRVLPNGSEVLGTPPEHISDNAMALLKSADLIISKGQANFETLAGHEFPAYYILMAKCPLVAELMNCKTRDLVLKREDASCSQG